MADEQNGSAFQNRSSEWKCIPEWKFRVEVHSRVEYLRGTKWPLWASVEMHAHVYYTLHATKKKVF